MKLDVLSILLLSLSVLIVKIDSEALPYGCQECNNKGFSYCYNVNTQGCVRDRDECGNKQVITSCGTIAQTCADLNYDCAGCYGKSGCRICAGTDLFCQDAALGVCGGGNNFNGKVLTKAQCEAKTDIAAVCTTKKTCSTCAQQAGCHWCPSSPLSRNPQGCSADTYGCATASTNCNAADVVCPGKSTSFKNMCDCTNDPKCSVCYEFGGSYNYICVATRPESGVNTCQASYSNCTAPQPACSGLINKYDPYGTRCDCLTNPACSICINNIDVPPMYCVTTSAPPTNTCRKLTQDCNDAAIICPTKLTCSACAADPKCSWCETANISVSSRCVEKALTCPTYTSQSTNCQTCATKTTCSTCNADSNCKWCYSNISGSAACVAQCDVTGGKQSIVTNCATADACNNYRTCSSCLAVQGCKYCEGNPLDAGSNYGAFCTSSNRCGGCQPHVPCTANLFTNCTGSAQDKCTTYTDCVSCTAQTAVCSWCEDGTGTRSCRAGCGSYTNVPSCTVFGPTTTGLVPTAPDGRTGPSTAAAGTGTSTTSTTVSSTTASTQTTSTASPTTTSTQTTSTASPTTTSTQTTSTASPTTTSTQTTSTTSPTTTSTQTTSTVSPTTTQTSSTQTGSTQTTTQTGSTQTTTTQTGSTQTTTQTGSTQTTTQTGSTQTTTQTGSTQTTTTQTGSTQTTTSPASPTSGATGSGNNLGDNGASNGFDWVALVIAIVVIVVVIIIIVIIVVVVKKRNENEAV